MQLGVVDAHPTESDHMAVLEFWRVGQTTPSTIAVDAPRLEAAGWDGMTVSDSQSMIGDSYVALAIAAQVTSSIGLAVGVTNPVTRHPAVTASAIAGIQDVSGGRAHLGVGRGDASLAHIGLSPVTPSALSRYLQNVQTYLRGDAVDFNDLVENRLQLSSAKRSDTAPKDSRLQWMKPTMGKVPVDVAASGPGVIRIAAQFGDGVSFGIGADEERMASAIELATSARVEAGLDTDSFRMGAYINLVAHPDESVAHSLASPGIAMFSRYLSASDKQVGPLKRPAATQQALNDPGKIRRCGAEGQDRLSASGAENTSAFGILGTPAYCVERLVRLSQLGLDRVMIMGGAASSSSRDQRLLTESNEVLIQEVFPHVRERLDGM